jgi:hypothetical protein
MRKLRLLLLVMSAGIALGLAAPQTAFGWTLTIVTQGNINGSVSGASGGNPSAFSCNWQAFTQLQSGVCSATSIPPNTLVTVTATPEGIGSKATWSNCTSVVGNQCYVENESTDRTITVTFTNGNTLTVTKLGSGTGTVTSAPAGINCGTDCTEVYTPGQVVTLTATAAAGSFVNAWGGACASAAGTTCTVTMSTDLAVTVTFGPTPGGGNLSVTIQGGGTVTSDPPGISCGTICSATFSGTGSVLLTESPLAGWSFVRWEGCTSVQGTICSITLGGSKSVKAVFRDSAVLASLLEASTRSGPGDARYAEILLRVRESVRVRLQLVRHGVVLASKVVSLQNGTRRITLRIRHSIAGGRATLQVIVTDDAGNTRTFTRGLSVPHR